MTLDGFSNMEQSYLQAHYGFLGTIKHSFRLHRVITTKSHHVKSLNCMSETEQALKHTDQSISYHILTTSINKMRIEHWELSVQVLNFVGPSVAIHACMYQQSNGDYSCLHYSIGYTEYFYMYVCIMDFKLIASEVTFL